MPAKKRDVLIGKTHRKRVPTDRENGLCELCLSVGTGVLDGPQNELTKYGPIADKYVHQLLHDFYDDLSVESYVIMPNHIHIMLRVDGEENGPSRTVQCSMIVYR